MRRSVCFSLIVVALVALGAVVYAVGRPHHTAPEATSSTRGGAPASASSATSPGGRSSLTLPAKLRFAHVFIILEENKTYR